LEFGVKLLTAGEEAAGLLWPGQVVKGVDMTQEEESDEAKVPEKENPLEKTGPVPTGYLQGLFETESAPTTDSEPLPYEVPSPGSTLSRERLVWVSALVVSWSITVVAVLRLMNIL
jgi:hypothetical protein